MVEWCPMGQGPSPRVRGKPSPARGHRWQPGSIPACAGETCSVHSNRCLTSVHPRVCGGNVLLLIELSTPGGPSPRVRGKLDQDPPGIGGRGSIPACAGETVSCSRPPMAAGVHPRVCGGNGVSIHNPNSRYGPSPRVRGKHHLRRFLPSHYRSIPACAGETAPLLRCVWAREVHPRVCGGNMAAPRIYGPRTGPSPRVRGKRGHGGPSHADHGSIPACAGETKYVNGKLVAA